MVVLSGYKTVKEALVNYADVFGEKDPPLIAQEFSQGHGEDRKKSLYQMFFKCSQYLSMILFNLRGCMVQWRFLERDEALCPDETEGLRHGQDSMRRQNH